MQLARQCFLIALPDKVMSIHCSNWRVFLEAKFNPSLAGDYYS